LQEYRNQNHLKSRLLCICCSSYDAQLHTAMLLRDEVEFE